MIVATRWTNGEIYERSDELEEAYAFLSHALRSARLAVKPAYEIIATLLNKLGKDEAALPTYEQGLIIKRNLYPSFDKNIAVTLMNIARIDQQLGRYMIALSPRSPPDRPSAERRPQQGDYYSTALAELSGVLETRQELFGAEHFFVSVTLIELSWPAQSKEGSLHSALIPFLRSLQIRRTCPESSTRALITSCYK